MAAASLKLYPTQIRIYADFQSMYFYIHKFINLGYLPRRGCNMRNSIPMREAPVYRKKIYNTLE